MPAPMSDIREYIDRFIDWIHVHTTNAKSNNEILKHDPKIPSVENTTPRPRVALSPGDTWAANPSSTTAPTPQLRPLTIAAGLCREKPARSRRRRGSVLVRLLRRARCEIGNS
ncbi:hypothetical protein BRADI_4g15018v3 [Brachypodium distachyon]|uniref:Uncharacterized protein n=1 Tax=Brachypodium distachyon TaxID=15368 RepID=A0A2K2CMX0_BRADI|nr:hypothetical protein BRADI_4g15018v3 [Brachypodium distachyon]